VISQALIRELLIYGSLAGMFVAAWVMGGSFRRAKGKRRDIIVLAFAPTFVALLVVFLAAAHAD
jgi:Na+-transporting NADH:ubiquinone oxidoreductase subunit NqrD